jgi:hypothetical protein
MKPPNIDTVYMSRTFFTAWLGWKVRPISASSNPMCIRLGCPEGTDRQTEHSTFVWRIDNQRTYSSDQEWHMMTQLRGKWSTLFLNCKITISNTNTALCTDPPSLLLHFLCHKSQSLDPASYSELPETRKCFIFITFQHYFRMRLRKV